MSDVTIKYKGQSIATMDASGTKTLGTQGKYCEGDIGVEYVKPAGPSGTKQISITQNGTTTEDVAAYANAEITVNVQGGGEWTTDGVANGTEPNGDITITTAVSTIIERAFFKRTGITKVTIDGNPWIGTYAFSECTGITAISVPNLTRLKVSNYTAATYVFQGCSNLTVIVFPSLTDVIDSYNFQNCSKLATADLGKCTRIASTFGGCSALRTMILRKTDAICTLSGNSQSYMGGIYSNPTASTIYVPSALIASYQTASNWSALYSSNNNIFQPIENSIYKTQYADGTTVT